MKDKCGGGDLLVRFGNSWMHLASACYSHQFGDMVTADVLHSIVFLYLYELQLYLCLWLQLYFCNSLQFVAIVTADVFHSDTNTVTTLKTNTKFHIKKYKYLHTLRLKTKINTQTHANQKHKQNIV